MKKDVILIPTYNERVNIPIIISDVQALYPDIHIIVIDDNSPDSTQDVVRELMKKSNKLSLHARQKKTGLGDAYKDALSKIMHDESIRYIITMDADGSHRPEVIQEMIKQMAHADLVIGSRYNIGNKHGTHDWGLRRQILSRCGNLYARILTGIPVRDLTAGFMCFKREIIPKINVHEIASGGYAYQIEFKSRIARLGTTKIVEVPITFYPRKIGSSKLSKQIIIEGMMTPLRLFLERFN